MKLIPFRTNSVLILFVLVLMTGCGGQSLNEVTGTVTFDGKKVKGLEVRFEPKDPSIGTTAIGYTQPDGTYTLHYPGDKTGAPAGEYTVHISGGETDPEEGSKPIKVAKKYNTQTELTATIKSGPNILNFDVTSK